MGWARGSEIADEIWSTIIDKLDLPDYKKAEIALDMVNIFEYTGDCDTMEETRFVEDYLFYDSDEDEWKIKEEYE